MKKLLTSAICSLLVMAGSAYAGHSGNGGDDRFERMRQHLQLTDEQVAEMRRIREEGGSREEMRAVLTDEQRARAQEARDAHGDKFRKRMREDLDLSDEQVAEMRRIREEGGGREEMQAVLNDEQRAKLEEKRGQYRKRKAEHHRAKEGV